MDILRVAVNPLPDSKVVLTIWANDINRQLRVLVSGPHDKTEIKGVLKALSDAEVMSQYQVPGSDLLPFEKDK